MQTASAGPSQPTEDHIKEEPQSPTVPESRAAKRGPDTSSQTTSGGKRKYRRHPKVCKLPRWLIIVNGSRFFFSLFTCKTWTGR